MRLSGNNRRNQALPARGAGRTRRQFLCLVGVAASVPVIGSAGAWTPAASAADLSRSRTIDLLGLEGEITLADPDRDRAGAVLDQCEREVRRLEHVVNLRDPDSAICALNRTGAVRKPPPVLRELIETATVMHRCTGTMFDISVQPLWNLYMDHFWQHGRAPDQLDLDKIAEALRLVGQDKVTVTEAGISFARPGMAVTLNGIAQGYVTDRITALLRQAGYAHVFVNLGEIRATGSQPDGTPWRVGVRDYRTSVGIVETIDIVDKAVATSGAYGTRFDAAGTYHHLIDPLTGGCRHAVKSVTVIAQSACEADAWSTALAASDRERFEDMAASARDVQIIAYTQTNERRTYNC